MSRLGGKGPKQSPTALDGSDLLIPFRKQHQEARNALLMCSLADGSTKTPSPSRSDNPDKSPKRYAATPDIGRSEVEN